MDPTPSGNKKRHLYTHGSSRARTTGGCLDHNVLCIIFSFLDLFDLAHCSVVCKSWHVVINKSKLLQVFYMKQQKLDGSTSLEKPLNVYLEELAMERHKLALAKGSIVVNQWRGHSIGANQCRMKRGLLLTGGGDKVMRLWSLGNYKCLEEYSTPDSTSVVDFDFDESKIVGLLGSRICIWRRDGARSVFPPREGTFSKGLCMRYLDPEAVVGCEDGTVRVFDMYSKKCSRIIRMPCYPSKSDAYRASDVLMYERRSTGTQRFFSRQCQHLKSFLRSTGFKAKNKRFHRLENFNKFFKSDLRALCFNPRSHLVFAGATSGNMSCWDIRTMRILWENRVSPNVLYSLQHLRNDSSTLVVGGIDGILRVLNQNTGEVVSRIVLAGSISSSRDKNGIVVRTRGARLAEDVHIDSVPKIIRPPITCLAVGMKKVVTTHNTKFISFNFFSQAYFDGFTYNLKYSRYLKLDCECNEEIPNTILFITRDGIAIRQATKSANAGSLRNQGPENVSSLEEVSDATSYLRRSDLMAAELVVGKVSL
ncbi:hypothetical protein G4B88_023414 [Cannabis sativa]|uniref:F-box domain-containing protein n=1 Tax=Cannabis sativa TaxID=3483 RepID=A0A7J6DKN0_CANSA|nr:hypothetical protein G4B88_023414 [Cannabis sativa]